MADSPAFEFDAEYLFNKYLYDYLVKNKMYETAKFFKQEADVSNDPPGINSSKGFLHEWWILFYDSCLSNLPEHQRPNSEVADINLTEPTTPHPIGPELTPNPQMPMSNDFHTSFGEAAMQNYLQFLESAKLDPLKSTATSSSRQQMQPSSYPHLFEVQDNSRHNSSLGRTTSMGRPILKPKRRLVFRPETGRISCPLTFSFVFWKTN